MVVPVPKSEGPSKDEEEGQPGDEKDPPSAEDSHLVKVFPPLKGSMFLEVYPALKGSVLLEVCPPEKGSHGLDVSPPQKGSHHIVEISSNKKVTATVFPLNEESDAPKDEEEAAGTDSEGEKEELKIKRAFLRKCYSVLLLQLIITLLVITFFCPFRPELNAEDNRAAVIRGAIFTIVMGFVVYVTERVEKSFFLRTIVIGVMTVAEIIIIAAFAYRQDTMLKGFAVTVLIGAVLMLFACHTKAKFAVLAVCYTHFVSLVICLVMIGLRKKIPELEYVYGFVGVFVQSLKLVFDTQEVHRKYNDEKKGPWYIQKGDYVHAASKFFTDMAIMLLYMDTILYAFGPK